MNRIALLELADFLEALNPERFDITTWRKLGKKKVGYVSDESLLNDFNTVACPVGWGCLLKSWKEAGLYIDRFEVKQEYLEHSLSKPHVMSMVKLRSNPELDSYEAVQAGLHLYPRMAEVLFGCNNYADEEFTSPETVAERIREFCSASEDELQNLILTYDDH
ncbi:hypothetical protein [Acinetobacter radioresistens]|uniref:hypothetical protein n=1 Tax=Acinetobacter radioresistens TaxID=40216 RepID=UPI00202FE1B3|nr:hypothetical protein [Acinetobacter radioresistens]MCM1933970.1 hypothetical protein [Acinetobacter radioresistens]MCM1951594.1 hypothetical protein [Acinetobacter radioresistens]MCU4310130.1 hypothetical protein [Acinetobacter radioresistens]MCU4565644.1 hypothetical protein [Acinetobacter radioresistens]MCX0344325.1 hypothetical protein [Acinetobacter radioresistens]